MLGRIQSIRNKEVPSDQFVSPTSLSWHFIRDTNRKSWFIEKNQHRRIQQKISYEVLVLETSGLCIEENNRQFGHLRVSESSIERRAINSYPICIYI